MKAEDGWFRLEVGGDVLLGDTAEIRKIFPGTLLRLEGMRSGTVGMLMARYEDEQTVHEGIAALEALGVGVHSPHNWYANRRLDLVREAARTADPLGLLNPGKIPDFGTGNGGSGRSRTSAPTSWQPRTGTTRCTKKNSTSPAASTRHGETRRSAGSPSDRTTSGCWA
ncbi:hypothetical protein ACIOEX_30285 [Streptomyces sp. NPDC087850]|uniref:hypothetical protein n=1 Tax=Streptomyces sp. NPDC087850 TaxID=3365809 RepID=UPI0038115583